MKRYAKFLMIFVFSVVTLTACSGDSESSGKVLKVAKDVELASMDQHIATDGLSFEVIAATIEGLYTLDADGNAIPAIAKSYDVSEDGLVYTFHLREDAKWSNGEPVTANDFVYAWRRLVDPNTASEYAFIMDVAGVVNAASVNAGEASLEELGVNAVDDYTLEVTLALPVPFFLQLMTFPSFFPMNEAFVNGKEQITHKLLKGYLRMDHSK